MNNLQIIKQLLNGNHLSKKELEKAKKIIHSLKTEFNLQCMKIEWSSKK